MRPLSVQVRAGCGRREGRGRGHAPANARGGARPGTPARPVGARHPGNASPQRRVLQS